MLFPDPMVGLLPDMHCEPYQFRAAGIVEVSLRVTDELLVDHAVVRYTHFQAGGMPAKRIASLAAKHVRESITVIVPGDATNTKGLNAIRELKREFYSPYAAHVWDGEHCHITFRI